MSDKKKWLGEERRKKVLSLLKERTYPQPGSALGEELNVSRQVIVQDISLLKAKNIPIMATNRGYVLADEDESTMPYQRLVVCSHAPEETKDELFLLVDQGVIVKDVKIEHPIYGDITASVMVSNRKEVQQFIDNIKQTGASYLSELTNGLHLHTLEAKSEQDLEDGIKALREHGYLVEDDAKS
ncbi:transcription repressor NadR [Bacillus shivajii]|uniref:transcription repressor NadR n=1 Tax=Bacillus shivajii TaxID=1983719 RepID=UPI001CFC2A94|nr:transcription repressor NadR [Bacillus shivajii]UCZ54276.1 transcription repressor NadR [Bacillus shivajii]